MSDLTEGHVTILYTILTGQMMDVGQYTANEIHQCAKAAGKATLGHPSLITHLCSLAGWTFLYPEESNAGPRLFLFSEVLLSCSQTPEAPPTIGKAWARAQARCNSHD